LRGSNPYTHPDFGVLRDVDDQRKFAVVSEKLWFAPQPHKAFDFRGIGIDADACPCHGPNLLDEVLREPPALDGFLFEATGEKKSVGSIDLDRFSDHEFDPIVFLFLLGFKIHDEPFHPVGGSRIGFEIVLSRLLSHRMGSYE
jgi:hypothetical protein